MGYIEFGGIESALKGIIAKDKKNVPPPQNPAGQFIECLKNAINSSGLSPGAIQAIGDFTAGDMIEVIPGQKYYVIVQGVPEHRDSLYSEKYSGVDNMAELLDTGYSAGNYVYGYWHGDAVRSMKDRPGAHFSQSAISDFMSNYASIYGVTDIRKV